MRRAASAAGRLLREQVRRQHNHFPLVPCLPLASHAAPRVLVSQARHASGSADKRASVADDLAAKVKAGLDSSPELKQTLEELQRNTAGLADRCVCGGALRPW